MRSNLSVEEERKKKSSSSLKSQLESLEASREQLKSFPSSFFGSFSARKLISKFQVFRNLLIARPLKLKYR